MIRSSVYLLSIFSAVAFAQTSPSGAAWVWFDGTNSSSPYGYNSLGRNPNRVQKTGTGTYTVTLYDMAPLDPVAAQQGNVQVTAYGASSSCKSYGRRSVGPDMEISVSCESLSGPLADSPFTLLYFRQSALGIANAGAYASILGESGAPSIGHSWPASAAVQVSEIALGRYTVTLNAPDTVNTVLVTSQSWVGRCRTGEWGGSPRVSVTVYCENYQGLPLRSNFDIAYVHRDTLAGLAPQVRLAYLWSGQLSAVSTTEFAAPPPYSFNSTGAANRIRRNGVGNYIVLLGGPLGLVDTSHAQVQAYGVEPGQCRTDNWDSGGNPVSVSVRCFNGSGLPADRPFVLFYASAPSSSCAYEVSPAALTAPAGGGTLNFSVSSAGCSYRVTLEAGWAILSGSVVGSSNSTMQLSVSPNPGPEERQMRILVAGREIILRQAGSATCAYTASLTPDRFAAAGAQGQLNVATSPLCSWAASGPSWVSFPDGSTRTGPASLRILVSPNPAAAARSATLTVAGQNLTIQQSGASVCNFTLAPSSVTQPASGGNGSVDLDTGTGCSWTAGSVDPWITILTPASGVGPARISYRIAPNAGSTFRVGSLQVQATSMTITQSAAEVADTGACTYTLAPFELRVDTNTRTYRVQVRTQPGCSWTAAAGVSWLRINSGSLGVGPGSFELQAANYSGSGRRGFLTVADKRLNVSQGETLCAWLIDVPVTDFPQAGGTVMVRATSTYLIGCYALFPEDWARPSWVSFPRDIPFVAESGPDRGSVRFPMTIRPNPDRLPRTGVVTIEGYSYEFTQAGAADPVPCLVTTPALPLSAAAEGASFNVNVAGASPCRWSAQSGVSWITLPDGISGTGPQALRLSVASNPAATARSGFVTINEQRIAVEQRASSTLSAMNISNVVSAANFVPGVSSGSWATVFGSGLSPLSRSWEERDFIGTSLPKMLDGVRVLVNGREAGIAYISPAQINFQTPDIPFGVVTVEVVNGAGSARYVSQNTENAPGLFGYGWSGRVHAAAVHPDGVLVGPLGVGRPVRPGQTILLFGTGFGSTNPVVPAGVAYSGAATMVIPVQVRIGGTVARVGFAGLSSTGLYQFNVTVPDLATGEYEVVVDQLGFRTQAGVLLNVQR